MKEMVGGCCVCSDERGWPENPLVYCDGQNCTVAVHQACYGIVTVPTGPWYCRKCESQERSARVRCELCPSRDGALKKTDNQGWAHVVCALYIPEVRFGNVTTMEPIILQLIPQERYAKTCYICQEVGKPSRATVGACMQCNKSNCKQQFHVTCAQSLGLLCEEAGNYLDNVKYCGYCQHHYSKLKKGGNVKTIPPYKPITHDASSDSGSSPEKEIDSTINASSSSSTSATSIKILTNLNATSSTSVTSNKQRKSSTVSKQSTSSSTSSSTSTSSTILSSGSAGSSHTLNVVSGNAAVGSSGGINVLSGNNGTSANSSLIVSGIYNVGSGAGTNSLTTKSSTSNYKDKDKHNKNMTKISSSTKDKERDASSSSSSSRESRDKSSKSSKLKDFAGSTSMTGNVSNDQISGIFNTNASSNQNLGPSVSNGANTTTISNSKELPKISTSLYGNEIHASNSDSNSFGTISNTDSVMSISSSTSALPLTGKGTSNSSLGKKRKADSKSVALSDDINHPFRDIIKDVSVTLTPLPQTDFEKEIEKSSKKQKTSLSPPAHQSSNELQNVNCNQIQVSTGLASSSSSSVVGSSGNNLINKHTANNALSLADSKNSSPSQSVSSLNITANVTTSSTHSQKLNNLSIVSSSTSTSKDHQRDERTSCTAQPISVTPNTLQTTNLASSAPSLYVSVPLSTANVPGVNLPSATPSSAAPSDHSSISGVFSRATAATATSSHQNPSTHSTAYSMPLASTLANTNCGTGVLESSRISHQSPSLLDQGGSNSYPAMQSPSSITHGVIHQSGKSPSTCVGSASGIGFTATTTESGNLKISYEKNPTRVAQLQEQESAPLRRSRSRSGESGLSQSTVQQQQQQFQQQHLQHQSPQSHQQTSFKSASRSGKKRAATTSSYMSQSLGGKSHQPTEKLQKSSKSSTNSSPIHNFRCGRSTPPGAPSPLTLPPPSNAATSISITTPTQTPTPSPSSSLITTPTASASSPIQKQPTNISNTSSSINNNINNNNNDSNKNKNVNHVNNIVNVNNNNTVEQNNFLQNSSSTINSASDSSCNIGSIGSTPMDSYMVAAAIAASTEVKTTTSSTSSTNILTNSSLAINEKSGGQNSGNNASNSSSSNSSSNSSCVSNNSSSSSNSSGNSSICKKSTHGDINIEHNVAGRGGGGGGGAGMLPTNSSKPLNKKLLRAQQSHYQQQQHQLQQQQLQQQQQDNQQVAKEKTKGSNSLNHAAPCTEPNQIQKQQGLQQQQQQRSQTNLNNDIVEIVPLTTNQTTISASSSFSIAQNNGTSIATTKYTNSQNHTNDSMHSSTTMAITSTTITSHQSSPIPRTPDSGIFSSSSFSLSSHSSTSASFTSSITNAINATNAAGANIRLCYEAQSSMGSSMPTSPGLHDANLAATTIKDSPPSSPGSEAGSLKKRGRKPINKTEQSLTTSEVSLNTASNDFKDVKIFQNGNGTNSSSNTSNSNNNANASATPQTQTPVIMSQTALHMLGNQLNPSSNVAQKLSDQLQMEIQDHSIYTPDSIASPYVGVPLPGKTTRSNTSSNSSSTTSAAPNFPVGNTGATSLASMFGSGMNGNLAIPQSLEQLLERQWEQGSQFLMEQAQHFDIASLLSCLHQLQSENVRLEEHVSNLIARRDHLLAVNARLAIPLNTNTSASQATSVSSSVGCPAVTLATITASTSTSSGISSVVTATTSATTSATIPISSTTNTRLAPIITSVNSRCNSAGQTNPNQNLQQISVLSAIENGMDFRHNLASSAASTPASITSVVSTGSSSSILSTPSNSSQQSNSSVSLGLRLSSSIHNYSSASSNTNVSVASTTTTIPIMTTTTSGRNSASHQHQQQQQQQQYNQPQKQLSHSMQQQHQQQHHHHHQQHQQQQQPHHNTQHTSSATTSSSASTNSHQLHSHSHHPQHSQHSHHQHQQHQHQHQHTHAHSAHTLATHTHTSTAASSSLSSSHIGHHELHPMSSTVRVGSSMGGGGGVVGGNGSGRVSSKTRR